MTFGRRVYPPHTYAQPAYTPPAHTQPASATATRQAPAQPIWQPEFGAHQIDIGKIWSTSLHVVRENFAPLGVLAVLCSIVPDWLSQAFPGPATGFFQIASIGLSIGAVQITSRTIVGLDNSLNNTFEAIGANFFRIFLMQLVIGLGVFLGTLALIIPGIFLCMMWSVSTAVRVVEGQGVFASLKRSAELTAGFRWRILVFTLLTVFAIAAAALPVLLLTPILPAAVTVWGTMPVFVALALTFVGVAYTALYHQLRTIKEGSAAASVFD